MLLLRSPITTGSPLFLPIVTRRLGPLEGGQGSGQPSADGDGLEVTPDEPASADGVQECPSAEGREPRVARDPAVPTDEERKRHDTTHLPFYVVMPVLRVRAVGESVAPWYAPLRLA